MDNCILAHRQLKIYGTYACHKQLLDKLDMIAKFASTEEAEAAGYRPCSKCMPAAYKVWKETHKPNRAREIVVADYVCADPDDNAIWSALCGLYIPGNRKDTSYKYVLLKAILDNLFNTGDEAEYKLSYDSLFSKFTEIYWNIIAKYEIRQKGRFSDGKGGFKETEIEKIIKDAAKEYCPDVHCEFEKLASDKKAKIVKSVKSKCKGVVVASLYKDTQGVLYGFTKFEEWIQLNPRVCQFLRAHKRIIEKVNYYEWAHFLEKVNTDEDLLKTLGLLGKLEKITKRENLDVYRRILYMEFEHKCFYCERGLTLSEAKVDHVIPWDFVQDDKIWNFVLACQTCNSQKSNKLPGKDILERVSKRNHDNLECLKQQCQINRLDDMFGYTDGKLQALYKCAKDNGWDKQWE